jgi:hypothetical protein
VDWARSASAEAAAMRREGRGIMVHLSTGV